MNSANAIIYNPQKNLYQNQKKLLEQVNRALLQVVGWIERRFLFAMDQQNLLEAKGNHPTRTVGVPFPDLGIISPAGVFREESYLSHPQVRGRTP